MATLSEVHDLFTDGELIKKTAAALTIWAQGVIDQATPDASELAFAAQVMNNPTSEAHRVIKYVVAANSDATVAQIQGAGDAAIQSNVDAAAPKLAGA